MEFKNFFSHFSRSLKGFFSKTINPNHSIENDIHLQPKYWPEVVDFMNTIKTIVKTQTIDEGHIQSLNNRIISYVEHEINEKGSMPDIEARYKALDQLADRILAVNLNKIVGLKKSVANHPPFTEAVETFKVRLHERKALEEQLLQQGQKSTRNGPG